MMRERDQIVAEVVDDMVCAAIEHFPEIGRAVAEGGQHAAAVLDELRAMIVTGLRRRGYDP